MDSLGAKPTGAPGAGVSRRVRTGGSPGATSGFATARAAGAGRSGTGVSAIASRAGSATDMTMDRTVMARTGTRASPEAPALTTMNSTCKATAAPIAAVRGETSAAAMLPPTAIRRTANVLAKEAGNRFY